MMIIPVITMYAVIDKDKIDKNLYAKACKVYSTIVAILTAIIVVCVHIKI